MSNTTSTKEAGRVFIGAYIPVEMKRKLDEITTREDGNFSATIRKALRLGVAHFSDAVAASNYIIHCAKQPKRSASVARRVISK